MPSNKVERSAGGSAGTSIQCLDRAMAILNRLAESRECRVRDLASELGLNATTVHNILRTLTAGGYAINIGGRYTVGPSAVRLALHGSPLTNLPRLVAPAMVQMSRSCGEAGFFGALIAQHCDMIPVSRGTDVVTVQMRRKRFDFPLAVAIGRLLVAFEPVNSIEQIIGTHIETRRERTADEWRGELARVRRERCVVLCRHDGVDAVAVPLCGADARIIAALGASCPNYRGTPEHLAEMLRSLASAASATETQQGWRGQTFSQELFQEAIERSTSDHFNEQTGPQKRRSGR